MAIILGRLCPWNVLCGGSRVFSQCLICQNTVCAFFSARLETLFFCCVGFVAGPWSTCLEADHACSAWGYRGGSGWGSVRRLRHKWLQQCAICNIAYRSLTFLRHSGLKDVITQPHEVSCWEYRNSSLILERGSHRSVVCRQTNYNPEVRAISWSWSPGVCRRLEALPFEDHRCLIFQIQLGLLWISSGVWESGVLWFGVFCWVPSFTLSLSDSWISRNNWGRLFIIDHFFIHPWSNENRHESHQIGGSFEKHLSLQVGPRFLCAEVHSI